MIPRSGDLPFPDTPSPSPWGPGARGKDLAKSNVPKKGSKSLPSKSRKPNSFVDGFTPGYTKRSPNLGNGNFFDRFFKGGNSGQGGGNNGSGLSTSKSNLSGKMNKRTWRDWAPLDPERNPFIKHSDPRYAGGPNGIVDNFNYEATTRTADNVKIPNRDKLYDKHKKALGLTNSTKNKQTLDLVPAAFKEDMKSSQKINGTYQYTKAVDIYFNETTKSAKIVDAFKNESITAITLSDYQILDLKLNNNIGMDRRPAPPDNLETI